MHVYGNAWSVQRSDSESDFKLDAYGNFSKNELPGLHMHIVLPGD